MSLILHYRMSNFPLQTQDVRSLQTAFSTSSCRLKNLKLSVESSVTCNRETAHLLSLLCASLEVMFVTGLKHIECADTVRVLCACPRLVVLSLMYRNRRDVEDLYRHADCFHLLCQLSWAPTATRLRVLSLEYGPLVDYAWQDKYKRHIAQHLPSLVWLKIGQNRIKNPFLPTVISQNVKCNRFCLSWNANA